MFEEAYPSQAHLFREQVQFFRTFKSLMFHCLIKAEFVQVLQGAGAIQPILVIMQEHRTELLRQQAVWMVERILRNADLARLISGDASIHTALVDAFRHGNYDAKQFAEKALKHLNKIPSFSGVFQKL